VRKTKRTPWSALLAVLCTIDPGGDVLSPEAAFIHLKDLILARQYLQDVCCPGGSTLPLAVAKSILITERAFGSVIGSHLYSCRSGTGGLQSSMALSQWIYTAENLGHASWEHERDDAIVLVSWTWTAHLQDDYGYVLHHSQVSALWRGGQ
jgi:hypothetical protein